MRATTTQPSPGSSTQRPRPARRVSFVDMYPLLTLDDLVDGVHPNDAGYAKLAAAWAEKLATLRPAPPAVSTRSCPCSIWGPGDAPATPQVATTTAAEVGVKFRTEKDGFITAVRFYKGPDNAGPHDGQSVEGHQRLVDVHRQLDDDYRNVAGERDGDKRSQQRLAGGRVRRRRCPCRPTRSTSPAITPRSAGTPPTRATSAIARSCTRRCACRRRAPSTATASSASAARDCRTTLSAGGHELLGGRGVRPDAARGHRRLTATAVSASQIDVSWSAVTDATGYRVERSPDSTTGVPWARSRAR